MLYEAHGISKFIVVCGYTDLRKGITGCVLRPPAVGGALSSGRGAVMERSAGGDHRPIISYIYLSSFRFIITV